MKKVLYIGFGVKTIYDNYVAEKMSSRLLYGMDLLGDSFHVEYCSLFRSNFKGNIRNNIKVLGKYDVIFFSYFYAQPVILLSLMRRIGIFRNRKLVAISHFTLNRGVRKIDSVIMQMIYDSFDMIFFHSHKNMEESINLGLIEKRRSDFLQWGEDLDYIDRSFSLKQGNTFISTGRECRDFPIVIDAFKKVSFANLFIYTNKKNYENDYSYLSLEKEKYPNVIIEFVEKLPKTPSMLATKTAECLCVVIPIEQNSLFYCVGLTSVVEAMAMAKPIISTRNPYYPIDIEKEGIGFYVDNEDGWVKAIEFISTHPKEASEMGKRARILAEEKYNIRLCASQLKNVFEK